MCHMFNQRCNISVTMLWRCRPIHAIQVLTVMYSVKKFVRRIILSLTVIIQYTIQYVCSVFITCSK